MQQHSTMYSPQRRELQQPAPGRKVRGLAAIAVLIAGTASVAFAAPYLPASDQTVLMQVPAAAQQHELRPLRAALAADPESLPSALALAQAYLELGRSEGDPRFVSYAQATLAPWLQRSTAPVEALVMTAIALQSLHHFDEATGLLARALKRDPRNAQAWLTRATIEQVRGEFAAARHSCTRLIGIADPAVALACVTATNAMTGRLEPGYRSLALIADGNRDPKVRGWLLAQLGEMAVRLGRDADAENHFRNALAADPSNTTVAAEYADLLLRQHRPQEVVTLLSGRESQDTLLLRLAIAGERLGTRSGSRWSDLYAQRYAAALFDGDVTHLREHARYELDVRQDRKRALALAARNWQVQREPADVRVYWHASTGVERRVVEEWIAAVGYEDATLSVTARSAP
jgi:Tfp pilus assembly protein PilF